MATEPLRNLNNCSAKASTWAVRILHPKQDTFTYGRDKQSTMYTFDCLLVSDDPAVYCGGAWKSPKEQDIKAAMEKLKANTSWKMSKVVFDTRAKPAFMSHPHKFVVDMKGTTWVAVLTSNLPTTVIPKTSITKILNLRDPSSLFDMVGLLVSGPVNERTPTTKNGLKRIADFKLRQEGKDGAVLQLEVSAWEPLRDELEKLVGQWVCLFKVEAKLTKDRKDTSTDGIVARKDKVTCETSTGGIVLKLPPDASRDKARTKLMECSESNTTTITATWEPTEAALTANGPQPLVCASFLHAIAGSLNFAAAGPSTWQLVGAYVEAPTGTIFAQGTTRIWFATTLRDQSGDVEVWADEKVALGLANVKTSAEFEKCFEEGSLLFHRCNVRGAKIVRNGKVEYRILEARTHDQIQPFTKEASNMYALMKVFGRTTGGIVPARLIELESDPFAGIVVEDFPVRKAIIFVKGTERSHMDKLGDQRKMVTSVTCAFDETDAVAEKKYQIIAFCHENNVSDFKFDQGYALAVLTGIHCVDEHEKTYELVVDSVTTIIADNVSKTRSALQTLAEAVRNETEMSAPSEESVVALHAGKKRCRFLEAYPSDPM